MNVPLDYLELKKKYDELQLRVTRFSVIEQELIHARNLMDREVMIYRQMQLFNTRALLDMTDEAYCRLVAESIIDIFEVETAFVVSEIPGEGLPAIRYMEGFAATADQLIRLHQYLEDIFTDLPSGTLRNFEARNTDHIRTIFPIRHLMCTQLYDPAQNIRIFLLAGITDKGAPFYEPVRKDREAAFTVFCQQVLGHQTSRFKTNTIKEQFQIQSLEQKRITTIAELLLGFDPNPDTNIQKIVTLSRQILNGTSSIYEEISYDQYYISGPDQLPQKPDPRHKLCFQLTHQTGEDISCQKIGAAQVALPGGAWLSEYINYNFIGSIIRIDKKPVGTLAVLLDSTLPINDIVFQLIRILSAAIAVEERRKNVLKALSESEEKYRMIFEGTPTGIIIADPGTRRFLYVNQAACRLFGYTEEEFLNLTIADLHRPEDLKQISSLFEKLSVAAMSSVEEIPCLHRSKTIFYCDIYSSTISFGGRTMIAGFFSDVTQRHTDRLAILKNNTELKKINAELDNFVYSVSHDLRSPLLAVKGLVQLIETRQKEKQAVFRYIRMIAQSADRMDDTIKEILDYSRNSRLELDIREIRFEEMARQIFNDVKHISQSPVSFDIAIKQDSPFYSDIYRVGTLFKNLISNAVKYKRKDATDAYLRISVLANVNEALIRFEDNGEGIDPQHHDRIFDMFYRASTTAPGTGLGLYICKEIVNNINGSIKLESIPGKGSVFTVMIQNKYKQV